MNIDANTRNAREFRFTLQNWISEQSVKVKLWELYLLT